MFYIPHTTCTIYGKIYVIGGSSGFLYALGAVPQILTVIEAYNTGVESYGVELNGKNIHMGEYEKIANCGLSLGNSTLNSLKSKKL
ncbi:hypothetical protein GF312_12560 [Candidatus Poribacteria bacterium]|nr:hypothetical protein [Candidatus Poribacteria bacterium]